MLELWAALGVFVGGHILISGTRLRQRAAGAIGEIPYLALFTLFAGGSMLWVGLSYRTAPWFDLWQPPLGLRWLSLLLMALALWLLVDGLGARLRARPALPPATGAHAVTRQPLMVPIVLWAAAHLLVRGDAATMALFGSFAVLGIAGALSQDRKSRARHGDTWQSYGTTTAL
ncbi:MAG: NnrU family protein, partial [Alphaproteobacteria bacterium]|nr:NnrU family protein [Alphaproteobacteria bacterium]